MSYRIEGKDIVLSGFQDGIANDPYSGIADMRNVEIISIPGEASVQFKEIAATAPPVINAAAFTASASTDRLIWAGPNTLYEGAAISLAYTNSPSYLVVAGGGGGGGGGNSGGSAGSPSGGGGAGGMKTGTLSNLAGGAYTITVGAGGAGGAAGDPGGAGTSGSNSSIAALVVSTGGGGGGRGGSGGASTGANGGSGGGGGANTSGSGTSAGGSASPAGQGNNGGLGQNTANQGTGGGGGAGAVGTDGDVVNGGNGGNGSASSISGASVTYAGGGGGSTNNAGGGSAGTGGTGGGGAGKKTGSGTAGTANLGGGGGGASNSGGNPAAGGAGGSGTVVLSYTTGSMTATGGTITTSGGNTIHTFTTNGTFTVTTGGLSPGVVYYVRNIVGLTFQLSLGPNDTIIDITSDSAGTFTTYQYGNQRGISGSHAPCSYFVDRDATAGSTNAIYIEDASNYVWVIFPAVPVGNATIPANTLIFLGNIGGVGASSIAGGGLVIWKGYLFLFGHLSAGIDVVNVNSLWSGSGPAANWSYNWWAGTIPVGLDTRVGVLASQDDAIYFTSAAGVGSIIEVAGATFDSSNSATYTRNAAALSLPSNDQSTCLAELGTNLLVGGQLSIVYPWDRVSPSFFYPIIVQDYLITAIVGTNQNAYIFAGNRGRIYITNGSNIQLYKKIPDYLTGNTRPYFRWRDASFARNQLYFSFTATDNTDAALTTVNGAWAIDMTSNALRMTNKITNTGYSGQTTMVTEMPPASISDNPSGTSLTLGWQSGTTYGVDVGSSNPYDSLESFIEHEIIPVGTYLNPLTLSQIEWKTSVPIGGNGTAETIRVLYRTNLNDSFVQIGTTTATGTSVVGTTTGTTTGTYQVSDYYQTNFQKAQWIQLRTEMSSNATTPTLNRLTEVRIRDWPNTK